MINDLTFPMLHTASLNVLHPTAKRVSTSFELGSSARQEPPALAPALHRLLAPVNGVLESPALKPCTTRLWHLYRLSGALPLSQG